MRDEVPTLNFGKPAEHVPISWNDDLSNVLASTPLSILIVTLDLRIRRFTRFAEKNLDLVSGDVGRPLGDIKLNRRFPDLGPILREVIVSASSRECEVRDEGGGRFSLRAHPYLTHDNKIDGAVVSFVEVTTHHEEALFSTLIEQSPGAVFALDGEMRFRQLNPQTAAVFGHSGDLMGRRFSDIMEIMWGSEVATEIMGIFNHTLATGERYISPGFHRRRVDSGADESYEWEIQRLRFPNGKFGVVCYFTNVSSDRAMAKALRESKERFDIVKEGAQVGFWFCDLPFDHLVWDDLVKAHFWLPPEADVTIASFYERLHPDDRERTRAAIEQSIADKTRYEIEYRTVPAHGAGEKWIRAIGRTFYDSEGRPVRFDGVTLDITARRRAELDTRFLADVSRDLVGLSAVGEILEAIGAKLGAHLGLSLVNFLDVNEAADEVVVTHAWHRSDVPSSLGTYRLADYLSGEFQATLRAGDPFVVRDSSRDPRTNAERFATLKMGAFVCTPLVREGRWRFLLAIHHSTAHDWTAEEIELAREVTTRLWTRLERVRFEVALHESEARKEAILRSALDAIITMDQEGRLVEFNPAAERIFGHRRAAVLGRPLADVIIPERLRERHTNGLRHYLATGEGPVLNKQIELPALRADGTEFPAELAIVAIPGVRPPVFTAFLRDVTARKELENSLHSRAEELSRADRNKDEFLAMLAHELRNPLAPLRNAAELLNIADTSAGERAEAQSVLVRQIENMSRMLDDLLDVSRITEGKIELRRKPVLLASILTAAISVVRSSCASRGQKLSVSIPDEPVWLEADATRLEQVFGNLLTNASKYSGEGSHIALSAELVGGEVIVRVADDGAGIDLALLPHIFELFVQASRDRDRAHGGLGIGLTLVQRLVTLHGGRVEAHSDGVGRGAEFRVRLPILRDPPIPLPQAPESGPREASRRMLIVDDHKDSANSMAALQRRRGYEVRTAYSGQEALAIAAKFFPEVALIDIGLPEMDGFEVARRLRAMPELGKAFLVALSGYGSNEDRAAAKQAGFDEHMVKPADFRLLREWLTKRA